MSTPHNSASPGDFAPIVLMPGDPLRAKYIAEHYLHDVRLVNDVRGVQGYTGVFEDVPISVMASGMGMPSIAIYAEELYTQYGVEAIIRVGSAGALIPELLPRDIVIAQGACTNSRFLHQYQLPGTYAPICDFELLNEAFRAAGSLGVARLKVGNILSTDVFYDSSRRALDWARMGVLAVDMESAALYAIAAFHDRKALTINAISDYLPGIERPLGAEDLSPQEREATLGNAIKIALKTAVSYSRH